MSAWRRSEKDTASLRAEVDCPPDAAVYKNERGMMAVVYCVVGRNFTAWHLWLSHRGRTHPPAIEELLDCRQALLPGIDQWEITTDDDMPNVIHLIEVPEGPVHATRQ